MKRQQFNYEDDDDHTITTTPLWKAYKGFDIAIPNQFESDHSFYCFSLINPDWFFFCYESIVSIISAMGNKSTNNIFLMLVIDDLLQLGFHLNRITNSTIHKDLLIYIRITKRIKLMVGYQKMNIILLIIIWILIILLVQLTRVLTHNDFIYTSNTCNGIIIFLHVSIVAVDVSSFVICILLSWCWLFLFVQVG